MSDNKITCRHCGELIDRDSNFCPACGAINKRSFRTDPNRTYCVFCGSEIAKNEEFCPICGTPVREETMRVNPNPENEVQRPFEERMAGVTGKPWALSWQVPEQDWQWEAEVCMSRPLTQSVWKALRAFGISNRNRVHRPMSGKFLPGKTADTVEDPIQAKDVRAGRVNGRMRKRKTGEHRSANGSSSRWRPLWRFPQSF